MGCFLGFSLRVNQFNRLPRFAPIKLRAFPDPCRDGFNRIVRQGSTVLWHAVPPRGAFQFLNQETLIRVTWHEKISAVSATQPTLKHCQIEAATSVLGIHVATPALLHDHRRDLQREADGFLARRAYQFGRGHLRSSVIIVRIQNSETRHSLLCIDPRPFIDPFFQNGQLLLGNTSTPSGHIAFLNHLIDATPLSVAGQHHST